MVSAHSRSLDEACSKSWHDQTIERGVLALVILTPLAFGSVEDWSSSAMAMIVFLLAMAKVCQIWNGSAVVIPRMLTVFGGLFLAYVLLQLIPLPVNLIEQLSVPAAAGHDLSKAGSWRPLSIYPWATQQELLRVAAYWCLFLVIVSHYADRTNIQKLYRIIVITAACLTGLALLQKMTWNGKIFWFYETEAHTPSTANFMIWGPYVNRNHFAGYLEMVIPLAFAMSFYEVMRLRRDKGVSLMTQVHLITDSRHMMGALKYGIVGIALTVALFATLSRGGILSLFFSLSVLFILFVLRQRLQKRASLFALLALISLFLLIIIAWSRLEDRFERLGEEPSLHRAEVWKDSLALVHDFPIVGTGFGTFRTAYPKYQSHSATLFYDHAHNDYVELITEGGLVGALLMMIVMVTFGIQTYSHWLNRRGMYSTIMAAGGMASLAGMAFHSFVDFNLHVPANAILLTIVAGLTYSTVTNVTHET